MPAHTHPSDPVPTARLAAERGASLTELMVSLLIFLVFGGAMVRVTVQHQQILETQEEVVATQQDARGSLLIMSHALHAAGCGVPARLSDPGATGQNAAVLTATAATVSFRGCFSDPPVRATVDAAATLNAVPSALVLTVDTVADFAVGNTVYLSSATRWAYGTVTAFAAGDPALLTANLTVANVLPTTFAAGSRVYREEIMTFSLAGGALQQTLAIPPAAGAAALQVAPNVTTLALTYWNPTGTLLTAFPLSLADRRSIHRVAVDLGLEAQTRYAGSNQFLDRSAVDRDSAPQPVCELTGPSETSTGTHR